MRLTQAQEEEQEQEQEEEEKETLRTAETFESAVDPKTEVKKRNISVADFSGGWKKTKKERENKRR